MAPESALCGKPQALTRSNTRRNAISARISVISVNTGIWGGVSGRQILL